MTHLNLFLVSIANVILDSISSILSRQCLLFLFLLLNLVTYWLCLLLRSLHMLNLFQLIQLYQVKHSKSYNFSRYFCCWFNHFTDFLNGIFTPIPNLRCSVFDSFTSSFKEIRKFTHISLLLKLNLLIIKQFKNIHG